MVWWKCTITDPESREKYSFEGWLTQPQLLVLVNKALEKTTLEQITLSDLHHTSSSNTPSRRIAELKKYISLRKVKVKKIFVGSEAVYLKLDDDGNVIDNVVHYQTKFGSPKGYQKPDDEDVVDNLPSNPIPPARRRKVPASKSSSDQNEDTPEMENPSVQHSSKKTTIPCN